VLPLDDEYFPAAQALQFAAGSGEYLPVAQGTQEVAPGRIAFEPPAQAVQLADEPVALWNWPDKHEMHTPCPAWDWYWPAAQGVQISEPAALNFPASHLVQTEAPQEE